MFVHHADAAKIFHEAVRSWNLTKALQAARWMKEATGKLRLEDSLDLLVLMAWQEDYRAEKAGAHWIEGLTADGASDSEILVAAAAIDGMKDRDSRMCCERVLRVLCHAPRKR